MSDKNKKSTLELVDVDELVDYTDILNSLESTFVLSLFSSFNFNFNLVFMILMGCPT